MREKKEGENFQLRGKGGGGERGGCIKGAEGTEPAPV